MHLAVSFLFVGLDLGLICQKTLISSFFIMDYYPSRRSMIITPHMTCVHGTSKDASHKDRFCEYAHRERQMRRVMSAIEASRHMRAGQDGVKPEIEEERHLKAVNEEWRRRYIASCVFDEGELIEENITKDSEKYLEIKDKLIKLSEDAAKEIKEVERRREAYHQEEVQYFRNAKGLYMNTQRVNAVDYILSIVQNERDTVVKNLKSLYYGVFFEPTNSKVCWVNPCRLHRLLKSTRASVKIDIRNLGYEQETSLVKPFRLTSLLDENKMRENGWIKFEKKRVISEIQILPDNIVISF